MAQTQDVVPSFAQGFLILRRGPMPAIDTHQLPQRGFEARGVFFNRHRCLL
jgi:hypothetical protein